MPKGKAGRPVYQGLRVVTRAGTGALYLRGTVRGTRVFESAGTDNPVLAEEARATREAELYRGAIHGTKKTITFAQAALQYLKRPTEGRAVSKHTKMAIGRVAKHFGATITCREIDQNAIDRAGRALCREDAKAVTVLRAIVSPIRAVLTFAWRRGFCDEPSFETTKGGGARTDWFTPAEADAMITAASDHLKPMLAFLFCTGARVGEAVALDWRNVDLKYCRVTLVGEEDEDGTGGTKNGDDRIVDLTPRAVVALANIPGDHVGPVFLAPVGNPKAAKSKMTPYRRSGTNKYGTGGNQIRRAWSTALKGANITRHLTPHHARHTWATLHYLIHKDIVKLRIDGGWRTVTQCERYTKLAPDGLRADAEAFMAGRNFRTPDVQAINQDRKSA